MSDIITVKPIREKTSEEAAIGSVSFDKVLSPGETIATIVSIDEAQNALAFSEQEISNSILNINEVDVAAGRAIQFIVAGGVDGQTYKIKIKFTTSGGQTRVRKIQLAVKDE